MVIFSVLCEVKPNRDQSPGFFFINWELKLDSSNLTTVSVSSVIITCWKWALAGVSRPASGTDTRELVHFIHTCPTIQAWSRRTLIDVWERSTEKRVERVGGVGGGVKLHPGQKPGRYLCMQSAGRSTPGSPDKSCSPIPPLHNQGHTGSGPHGPHHMTYQASSHWWVPQV